VTLAFGEPSLCMILTSVSGGFEVYNPLGVLYLCECWDNGEKIPWRSSKKTRWSLRTGPVLRPASKVTSQLSSPPTPQWQKTYPPSYINALERDQVIPDVIPQVVRAFRSLLHDLSWGRDWLGRGNPPKPHAPRANNQNIE
jgi:hypothetical protein